jgi:hypothetical protein
MINWRPQRLKFLKKWRIGLRLQILRANIENERQQKKPEPVSGRMDSRFVHVAILGKTNSKRQT